MQSKGICTYHREPLHPLYVLKGSLSYLQQLRQVDDGYPQGYVKLQLLDVCVSYEMLTYFQEHYPTFTVEWEK